MAISLREVFASLLAPLFVAACGGSTTPAGAADGGVEGSPIPCGALTCSGGTVCVATLTGAGPCIEPDDAGLCSGGSPPAGGCCQDVLAFACATLPATCDGVVGCPCAASLCACRSCGVASPRDLECNCTTP